MNEVRGAVLQWLNSLGIRDPSNLDQGDYAKLRGLLSSSDRPGFGIFLSMLMFERQQMVAQLMTADLSDAKGAVRAAKMQGYVQCVDNMRDLILNIADPLGEGSDSDNRAGEIFRGRPSTAERDPVA
jgi:hypothetical protein